MATEARAETHGPANRLAERRPRFVVVAILLGLVWVYARFGGVEAPTKAATFGVGAFSQPQEFHAAPGGNSSYINLRRGPGTEFAVLERADRGSLLVGIARQTDRNGAYWIELERGRGYAKESVLISVTWAGDR